MPTTAELSFPLGRYHATPWGRHVNGGVTEWPPSPWRLLRALHATWRTRAPWLPAALVHALLDDLTALPTYLLPPTGEGHSRHYMPDGRRDPQRDQGREGADKVLDAFRTVSPAAPLLVRWPVSLPTQARAALATLLELLPHLGRADSVCTALLLPAPSIGGGPGMVESAPLPATAALSAGGDGVEVRLLAARTPLDPAALAVRTADLRADGYPDPPGSYWARYDLPAEVPPVTRPPYRSRHDDAAAVRWVVERSGRPSLYQAVAVGHLLRQAAQSRYGRLRAGATSPVLSGKSTDGERRRDDHGHAHYLSFGVSPGARQVEVLLAWAPNGGRGLAADELAALQGIRHLSPNEGTPGVRPTRLAVVAYGPVAEVAPELAGESAVWESVTPFAPTRHPRRRQPWWEHVVEQIERELAYRGLPAARAVEQVGGPWLSFRRHRPPPQCSRPQLCPAEKPGLH